MPANLSPEYKAAEAAFRAARDPRARLDCLREMLRTIPKHKGTEHLQADIKARIKDLGEQIEGARKGGGHGGPALVVRPQGAAQIALLGPPNAGKSALHARLTGSDAQAAPYPFTTQFPEPGMLPYEDVQFQLLDLPAISPEHPVAWLGSTLQTADAALLVLDLREPSCVEQLEALRSILGKMRVTLSERWHAGGDVVGHERVGRDAVGHARVGRDAGGRELVGREFVGREGGGREGGGREAVGREPASRGDHPPSDDPFAVVLPTLMLANKAEGTADLDAELQALRELTGSAFPALAVSARTGLGLGQIGPWLFDHLGVVRVYTKVPGHAADRQRPFTLRRDQTVGDVARLVHRDLGRSLRYARLWGASGFDGQQVGPEHCVADGDVVELHT